MRRLCGVLAGVVLAAGSLVVVDALPVLSTGAGTATESITIGEVGGPGRNYNCGADTDIVQITASASYVVPAGAWSLTSWSTLTGTGDDLTPATLQLEVWRATGGPSEYLLVGISPVITTTPPGLNSFALPVPIAVQEGDVLGLRSVGPNPQYGCQRRAPGSFGSVSGATPTAGDTRTFTKDDGNAECCTLDVTATLERPLPTLAPVAVPAAPKFTG